MKPFNLYTFAKEVHKLSQAKGWYKPAKTDIEALALVGCEVSEAIEEVRNAKPPIYFGPADRLYFSGVKMPTNDLQRAALGDKPEGVMIELADVMLRILDFCEHKKYDLVKAMLLKHEYNKTRPNRHGGKKA